MDFARLSELNIKTLRGYLLSYNVSTQGMLEKQDLIKAIQSYKPIPEASEVYFRQHLPAPAEKAPSLFGELGGLGRSESPTESTESSSSNSSSGDSWWDIDKFFSKLFSPDEQSSTARAQTGPNRSQPQSQQPQQPQYRPEPQTQYRPQPQAARASTNTTFNYNSSNTSSYSFRPPPENPPSTANTFRPPSGNPPPNPYYSTGQSPTANTFSPRPSPRPQAQTAQTPRTTTSTPRSQPQTSQPSQNSQQNTLTLDQLVTSDTDPSTLSIKVIKSILDHSCVSYVGVVEKKDLVDRLQKLIDNTKAEREMIREQEENAKSKSPAQSAKGSTSGVSEDDNLCKICCDAALNCVMLNCNHMSTCMDWYVFF
ncbi:hypothetical protein BGZ46_007402 [Entomortierella lignicola]|nr:hypothetical protein BGZ46_007402 [Entomortierella lignicola]